MISGGEVNVKSTGAGGKGLNSSQTMTISGGTIRAIAAGKNFSSGNDDVAAKAIKSAGDYLLVVSLGLECAESLRGWERE